MCLVLGTLLHVSYIRCLCKVKPLTEWEKLDMSSLERRKLCCSITFHLVAITCVIWSLYVLIERTTHEIEEGDLQWPFWTKLIVVAIGFTGGLIMKDASEYRI